LTIKVPSVNPWQANSDRFVFAIITAPAARSLFTIKAFSEGYFTLTRDINQVFFY